MKSKPIVEFLRRRDYKLLKELGQGASGKTVLLLDEEIGEKFVCKKYSPYSENHRVELFENFIREIALLHKVFHKNLVRVFNYYLYKENFSGYILMEFIDGLDIQDAIALEPERANDLFIQAIDGFQYLETIKILHRDIREQNILVTKDGYLKIIDLGFGKKVQESQDYNKSISLNLWCDPPKEFEDSKYDFTTEVYFVGKLFEKIINDNDIEGFSYRSILAQMCRRDPDKRINSFFDISKVIQNGRFADLDFPDDNLAAYRDFSASVSGSVTKIENGAKYGRDPVRMLKELEGVYHAVMLEETLPSSAPLLSALIDGQYHFRPKGFPVEHLKGFVQLLRGSTSDQTRVIMANLHTRLDAIPRYVNSEEDEIPF